VNTPAHVIFSLAILGPNRAKAFTVAIFLGALLPDVMMMVFYAYEKISGTPEQIIWNQRYFLPAWQNIFDITNSIPLFGIGLWLFWWRRQFSLAWFNASALIHCVLDLLVHQEDSHRHFYPFSDYRFLSPVSYWDPTHYGNHVAIMEILLFVSGSVYLLWACRPLKNTKGKFSALTWVVALTGIIYLGFFYFVVVTWMVM